MTIANIDNGESGSSVRAALNEAIDAVNGLGTAASLDVGTSANEVVQLDGSGKLPAVDGSQLTGVVADPGVQVTGGAWQIKPPTDSNKALVLSAADKTADVANDATLSAGSSASSVGGNAFVTGGAGTAGGDAYVNGGTGDYGGSAHLTGGNGAVNNGGDALITSGNSGTDRAGNVNIAVGINVGGDTSKDGRLLITGAGLPTADPHFIGQLWNNSGVVSISGG